MNQANTKLFGDLFENIQELTPDKLHSFAERMIGYCVELKEKFQSNEPSLREEAFNDALELKGILEEQMEKLSNQVGIDPSQLAAMAASNATDPAYEQVRQDIQLLKALFPTTSKEKHKRNEMKLVR